MPVLSLAPNHKCVRGYYEELDRFRKVGAKHENAVRDAFASVLRECGGRFGWTLVNSYAIRRPGRRDGYVDGALVDDFSLPRAYWEAKDSDDDLPREIKLKLAAGYPTDNIVFQAPDRAILYQGGRERLDANLTQPNELVDLLKAFFEYEPPLLAEWGRAVVEFEKRVPELAEALLAKIRTERKQSATYATAFEEFVKLCQRAINPKIEVDAVERMLIQHLLTERIFRKVFSHPDFRQNNVIAVEIEKVIKALTSRSFDRDAFTSKLDRFYGALEATAATISEYSEKQTFLNHVYERFFRGFDPKVADTHGIVYTPQSVVQFMVKSVGALLEKEFKRNLGDDKVQILDPFVGTGNFILQVMRNVPKTRLPQKYRSELHANEILLLPYYIASMNIEHEYMELAGHYAPFQGLCLVDTFELAERRQLQLGFLNEENTKRVRRQKTSKIMVIVGNPPYNADQQDENDRNANRKYPAIDRRVAETYVKASTARLRNKLGDPYVKAIRFATDRINDEGIIALVTNHSYLRDAPFDGMRKHLAEDFDAIYVVDLGGNVRRNPKLSGTTHNVFGIQTGVAIVFLVRRAQERPRARKAEVFFARTAEDARKEEKLQFLDRVKTVNGIEWERLEPNAKHTWLLEGQQADFEGFMPCTARPDADGTVRAVFGTATNGVKSNNDAFVFGFNRTELVARAKKMVAAYNDELARWQQHAPRLKDVDKFLRVDEHELKWVRKTKRCLVREEKARFRTDAVRPAMYRPYIKQHLFFDRMFNEDLYQLPHIVPAMGEAGSPGILVTSHSQVPFGVFATDIVPCLDVGGRPTHMLPFQLLGDGEPKDNVTDWCLAEFRTHYSDAGISKRDVFHYVYAVLHHTEYRTRYAANLQHELPRVPFLAEFQKFVAAGKKLIELHLGFEEQEEYPLKRIESEGVPLSWRVEQMKLTSDRTSIVYNEFLTLGGVPNEAFEYRIGARSALEWVIDQIKVTENVRSDITSDPNRPDDEEAIVRLIGQVVQVSVETTRIVRALPSFELSGAVKKAARRPRSRK